MAIDPYVAEKKTRLDVGGNSVVYYDITKIESMSRADTGVSIDVKGAIKKNMSPERIENENTNLQNQIDELKGIIDNNNSMKLAMDKVK